MGNDVLPWQIWFEVYDAQNRPFASGVYHKSYKRKCDAVRVAKANFDTPRGDIHYKWVVDKLNPWMEDENIRLHKNRLNRDCIGRTVTASLCPGIGKFQECKEHGNTVLFALDSDGNRSYSDSDTVVILHLDLYGKRVILRNTNNQSTSFAIPYEQYTQHFGTEWQCA